MLLCHYYQIYIKMKIALNKDRKKSKIFYDWICIWTINHNDKLKWNFEKKLIKINEMICYCSMIVVSWF